MIPEYGWKSLPARHRKKRRASDRRREVPGAAHRAIRMSWSLGVSLLSMHCEELACQGAAFAAMNSVPIERADIDATAPS